MINQKFINGIELRYLFYDGRNTQSLVFQEIIDKFYG